MAHNMTLPDRPQHREGPTLRQEEAGLQSCSYSIRAPLAFLLVDLLTKIYPTEPFQDPTSKL